jgi:hypothetical protein
VRSSNPFDNFTDEQLKYIGAVAMLYNDVEGLVNDLCAVGLHIPIRDEEVTTRINGLEGKYALIKLCAKHWGFDEQELSMLGDALGDGGFHGLKKWRDGVVHARLHDINSAVATLTQKQGKTEEILLSSDALKGLYERLEWMRRELSGFLKILRKKSRIKRGDFAAQHKERLEQEVQAEWLRVRERRSQRQSLPPMPEFPPDIFDFERFRTLITNRDGTTQ